MHNNLDKFVREKFQEREFEFKEDYWEDAALLIEQQEGRAFWKNFFIAAAGIALFFAGGIGGYYLSDSSQGQILADQSQSDPTTISSEIVIGTTAQTEMSLAPSTANSSEVPEETNPIANATLRPGNTTTALTENTSSQQMATTINEINKTNSSRNTAYTEIKELANKSILSSDAAMTSAAGPSDQEAIQEPTSNSILLGELSLLSNPLTHLSGSDINQVLAAKTNPDHPVVGGAKKRFSTGFTFGGTAFIHPTDQSKMGATAGLSFKYKLRPQFSINADVLYQYRPGQFSHTRESGEINYGFGLVEKLIRLQPTSLHSVEIPLYAQYQIGQQFFEAGISTSYLMGVRGGLANSSQLDNGLEPAYQIENKGWIEKNGFKNINSQLMLGYHLGIGQHTTIGLRANYSPSGILDSGTLFNQLDLKDPGKLQLSLMAKMFIF